jgi:hypothetical protein
MGQAQAIVDCLNLLRIRTEDQEHGGRARAGTVNAPGPPRLELAVDELEEGADVQRGIGLGPFHRRKSRTWGR